MNSFNPLSMMGMNSMGPMGPMGMMGMNQNPLMNMMGMMNRRPPSTNIPINQSQFMNFLPNIDDNLLRQIANQAKSQGISDQEIADGINFINSLRK